MVTSSPCALASGENLFTPNQAVGPLLLRMTDTAQRTGLLLLEREDDLPIFFHAYDVPTLLLGLGHERFGERADLRVRQLPGRAIRVLAFRVIVVHKHHEPDAVACARPLQHLLVACRIAKGGCRFSLLGKDNAQFLFGYRALYQDYKKGSGSGLFEFDATMHGPIVGLSIGF